MVRTLEMLVAVSFLYLQASAASLSGDSSAPRTKEREVCSSLSGPFCRHLDAMDSFADYMVPIALPTDEESDLNEEKRCFFQRFARSWMDSGGDANDIMSQTVASVEECEQLCCDHAQCISYTLWKDNTCFLRAQRKQPREDKNSFTGYRLT